MDIYAPLMSVRRSSSEAKLKVIEKKHHHTLVTEPLAVPLNLEHIPGRSKANDDDDGDEFYSDALDTLSSISMNCSESGVSGLNNLDDAKKCASANETDKQTQEFMMNRFLPAAKAMTFHPPQYASFRKQSVLLVQQPREITMLVRDEKKSADNKHVTDIVPYTDQFQEEEESGDEDDDRDESTNVSAKGCGMFHRLGARNSLCLLRNQFPMSSTYEYEKPNKSSHVRSYSPAPAIKKAWDAIHKSKSSSGGASTDMNDARRKWTSESNRFRRSSASSVAALQSSKPQSLFPSARLHCDSKQAGKPRLQSRGHGSIQDVSSQGTKRSSNSRSLATEKTLYIESSNSESEALLEADQENNQESSMCLQLVQRTLDKDDTRIIINNKKQIVAVDDHPGLVVVSPLLPPPLMPKSPSESWLSRALPLVYMKNAFPYSNQDDKSLGLNNASSRRYSKWETIVKTSNSHHAHVTCSQELAIYKPQHSKS